MPPSSSPAQSSRDAGYTSTSPSAEIYYTNEDVDVLHQIVVLAEQLLPTLPERERLPTSALFSAYDDVLPTIGIDADHDSRYARLLFKIGGLRGSGTLMDKFREVLSRMGIDIEFVEGSQQSGDQVEESQTEAEDQQATTATSIEAENERPKSRWRRSSEGSAREQLNESFKTSSRPRSFSSAEGAISTLRHGDRSITASPSAPSQLQTLPPRAEKQNGEDPRANVRTWLNSRPGYVHGERDESVSTRHSVRIHRREPSQVQKDHGTTTSRSIAATDEYQAASEETIPTSSLGQGSTINLKARPYDPYVPQGSAALSQTKAALIYNRHLGFFIRHQFRVWRDKAVQQREDNHHLNLIAQQRDKRILLSAAVDSWYRQLRERQRAAETEKFFAQLERRAGKARDLFLLHKAFTHWAQCALDEIERTSIARRHIVRTRIFNAWKEITAVNELKVRRHVLKRFFAVWKRQHVVIAANNRVAVQTYHGNLVERVYWKWFFKWCNNNAEIWQAQRSQRRILLLWANSAQDRKDHRDVAAEERRLWLAWNAWRFWRARTEEHIKQDRAADNFHQRALRRSALRRWRRETQVIPARVTVQTDVSSRLLREKFTVWLLRARQERQATAIDRIKIIREAWINWRYKLRSRALITRVDGRVVLQALYRWVLAERLVLVKRLSDQKLLGKMMQRLAQGWLVSRNKRWEQEDIAEDFVVRRTQSLVMGCWQERARSRRELNEVATGFYTPRLLQGTLSTWSRQTQHVQKLQRWAIDAEFYFHTKNTLKTWKATTDAVRRQKRRSAYVQVRRTHKSNLASRVLHRWRTQARQKMDMDIQASHVIVNKNVITGMNIFDLWRARTEELAELEVICQNKVVRKFLLVWSDRSVNFRAMQSEAVVSFEERQQDRAVRKWNLRRLQLRAQSNYALDIKEKNARKNFRKIFAYWKQKAAQKRPFRHADLDDTERAEAWSDFGEEVDVDELTKGLDDATGSTAIPGYLSTPSRRTERVMAAAVRFSTTPRVPLSTPFERHLRAQYSGNALPSLRKGPGRSRLAMSEGFEDIVDR